MRTLQDHPRVGGEKFTGTSDDLSALGSPPRGRGKEHKNTSSKLRVRITPAWAGKSAISFSVGVCYEDHPRVGGEKTKKIP